MPVRGPEICPRCQYNLRGLAHAHRCPECGLRYDRDTRLWMPRRPILTFVWRGGFLIAVVWVAPAIYDAFQTGGRDPALLLQVAIGLAAVAVGVAVAWRLRHGRALAAVTPDGVVVRQVRTTLIPWAEVAEVFAHQRQAGINTTTGRTILVRYIFDTHQEADEFCELVKHSAKLPP